MYSYLLFTVEMLIVLQVKLVEVVWIFVSFSVADSGSHADTYKFPFATLFFPSNGTHIQYIFPLHNLTVIYCVGICTMSFLGVFCLSEGIVLWRYYLLVLWYQCGPFMFLSRLPYYFSAHCAFLISFQ